MGKLKIENFEHPFQDGQDGMKKMVPALAIVAEKLTRISGSIKVLTIVLGAIAATNGVGIKLMGEANAMMIIAFTLVGLLISTLAGLEAVFRFEKRSSELTLLAASSEAEGYRHATRWHQTVALEVDEKARLENAKSLLEEQTKYIASLLKSSAELGVNLPKYLDRNMRDNKGKDLTNQASGTPESGAPS